MSKITDGGPAFPSDYNMSTFQHDHKGMSLRAYFAGQAMAPAMTLCLEAAKSSNLDRTMSERDVADVAIAIADALIAKLAES